jgi:hypothetical protein
VAGVQYPAKNEIHQANPRMCDDSATIPSEPRRGRRRSGQTTIILEFFNSPGEPSWAMALVFVLLTAFADISSWQLLLVAGVALLFLLTGAMSANGTLRTNEPGRGLVAIGLRADKRRPEAE